MSEELQQQSHLEEGFSTAQATASLPASPQKSSKKTWIIVGGIVIVVGLCLVACFAIFGTGMYKVYTEKAPIESVLDSYMRYMADKDAEGAYALFAPRAQRQIPISDVQEMLEGNNYVLFEGYQSLSVSSLNISAVTNSNPDVPQGTVAKVAGSITYEGEIQGTFNAVLEKVGEAWRVDSLHVSVPPSKIE